MKCSPVKVKCTIIIIVNDYTVAPTQFEDDDDNDLSDMEEGEGDATASKQLAKKQQVLFVA